MIIAIVSLFVLVFVEMLALGQLQERLTKNGKSSACVIDDNEIG